MSKKRAFVRYSKQGKIVPGSLILTGGSHPNGPSTWKEVPADLCCDGGVGCEVPLSNLILTETTNIPGGTIIGGSITLASEECSLDQVFTILNLPVSLNYTQLIDLLNTNFSFLGLFSYTAPNIISLQISSAGWIGSYVNNCPNAESWIFNITIASA